MAFIDGECWRIFRKLFLNYSGGNLMSFHIVKGDIFQQEVDAIVLTTSPILPLRGLLGSVARKICGDRLVLEIEQTKSPTLSECVITNAYNLPCKRIIHVATPKWNGGNYGEEKYLKQSYINCLNMLQKFDLHSISFPLLSGGAHEYPLDKAIEIAVETLDKFAQKNESLDISLVIYDALTWNSNKSILEKYAIEGGELSNKTLRDSERIKSDRKYFSRWYKPGDEVILDLGVDAQDLGQRLLFLIKSKGKTQQECYTGVISKTAFDKIIKSSISTKNTLVSLGINIGLDESGINELLAPIGERLFYYLDKDKIIIEGIQKYKNEEGVNRIDLINEELSAVGCALLKTN